MNNADKRPHKHRHRRHSKKRFWQIFGVVIGIVVIAGLIFAGMIYKNLRDTTTNMYTPVAKNTKSNKGRNLDDLLKAKKPINILLLGTDTGQ